MVPVVVALFLASSQAASVIAVSANGSDRGDGSRQRPVATLSAAMSIARSRSPRPVIIRIWPGTYRIEKAVLIGADTPNLTIQAESTGTRLIGGIILNQFRTLSADAKRQSGAQGVRVASLATVADLGKLSSGGFGGGRKDPPVELYCDGKRMTLARYPNGKSWLKTSGPIDGRTFGIPDDRPKGWASPEDVWAVGYFNYDWADNYRPVAAIDPLAKRLTLDEDSTYGVVPGRRFYLQNIPEELDEAGEYWVDRAAREVRYLPPAVEGRHEIVASTLAEPMFVIENGSNVTISGLELMAGRQNAITVTGGENVKVDRCWIHSFGTSGVQFNNSKNSGITGCDLESLGTTAISLNGGDRKTLTPAGLYAENNWIHNFSEWCRTYQPGLAINGVGNLAINNKIHDAPHCAILMGGNDHLIAQNEFFRVCQETGDAGALYMGRNPTMRGTIIRNNWFYDLGHKVESKDAFTEVMSVYLDDCHCGITVEGNLFEGPGTGIMIGGGRDNVVRGNVFVLKSPAVHVDARGRGWAKDMMFNSKEWRFNELIAEVDGLNPPYTDHYPALRTYMESPRDPKGVAVVGNASFGGQWLRLQDGLTEKDLIYSGNRIEVAPPARNQLLRSVSPAIEVSKIGLKPGKRPSN